MAHQSKDGFDGRDPQPPASGICFSPLIGHGRDGGQEVEQRNNCRDALGDVSKALDKVISMMSANPWMNQLNQRYP